LTDDEFEYLKFDVNEYKNTGNENSDEYSVQPMEEFTNLKFDVTKFIAANPGSASVEDIPVNKL